MLVFGSGLGLVSPHASAVLAYTHKEEVRLSMEEENAGDGGARDVMKVSWRVGTEALRPD